MTTRTLHGAIQTPDDSPTQTYPLVRIEVHDVSEMDKASTPVAVAHLRDVQLGGGQSLPFTLEVPEAAAGRSLSLQVHGSASGQAALQAGDLYSTAACPIPATGKCSPVEIMIRGI